MASVAECEAALHDLAKLFGSAAAESRRRNVPERAVACEITDLATTFRATLGDEGLTDIHAGAPDGAQIRAQISLRVSSDDLLALTSGQLNFATAWATGRIRIDASITDLLRLRSLL